MTDQGGGGQLALLEYLTPITQAEEYAVAAGLGMSVEQLAGFTRNAIRAAFTSDERKSAMLDELAGG